MKKLIAFILILLFLLTLVSCVPHDPGYANTVAYAGWSDDPIISDGALNKEQLQSDGVTHLPIFRMDTIEDLGQFKLKYKDVLAMDYGYNSVLSFEEALNKAQWDREEFFKEHSLLVIYVTAGSGSLRFGVNDVEVLDGSVCVYVEQKNNPEIVTDDMAGWFILVEVEDEEIRGCNSFDAVFGSLK